MSDETEKPTGARWTEGKGHKQIWFTLTPDEDELLRKAAPLGGYKSKAEFLRSVSVAEARKILAENGVKQPRRKS